MAWWFGSSMVASSQAVRLVKESDGQKIDAPRNGVGGAFAGEKPRLRGGRQRSDIGPLGPITMAITLQFNRRTVQLRQKRGHGRLEILTSIIHFPEGPNCGTRSFPQPKPSTSGHLLTD